MSCEQQARDLLERLSFCEEWADPQKMSSGDVVELANMFAEIERLRAELADCERAGVLLADDANRYRQQRDEYRKQFEWCVHHGGLLNEWARDYDGQAPLIQWLMSKVSADAAKAGGDA